MAPSHEKTHLAKGVMAYMSQIAEQASSPWDRRMARSSELKRYLLYLSERAPSAMNGLLNSASKKCGEALRAERESKKFRISKKRAEPPTRNERDAKRTKVTRSAAETTPNQPLAKSYLMMQGHTELSLRPAETELSSETILSVHGPQEDDTVPLPTKYAIEFGLAAMDPTIEAFVKASLCSLKPSMTRPHFDIDDEITKILNFVKFFLEFYKTKRELHQYLENRVTMPGGKLQTRISWNTTNPSEILDTLENVKRNTFDNKIHRAYGQTVLFSSVNTQVARGYKSTVTGHRSDHTVVLERLAREKAGSVSKQEVDQMISSYLHEYHAGQKWSAIIDWFGGGGIVLIFVTAGIGSWYVERKWTEFQRDCLKHVAGLLHSIRGLVEALGSDALELYCRNGCLGNDRIDRVKMVGFTPPDGDGDEDEVEVEGSEDTADEGSEDGEDEDEGSEDTEDEESEYDEDAGDESD